MFKSNSKTWLVALLALVLLAFALRMVQIGQLRMWGDEGFSVYSANRDLVAISFESKDVDPHPPLYYYLLHFYLPIAGFSEFSIRFLSVFFGTATVALIYAIGKRMFDLRVGLLATAIAALAPFGVQYSQEVRMYALVMFLGAIALWFFLQIANSELLVAKPQN
ncbi:MAG TPA: glycosyltransferase family 39 protein, partial [Anaerolineae bacterium]